MSHWPVYCFSMLTASNQGFLPFYPPENCHTLTLLFFLIIFIYLFVTVLLHRLFSSFGERGLGLVEVCGLLIGWLLLLQSMGSRHVAFSSCSTCVQ